MSKQQGRVSIGEVMGSAGGKKLSLKDLPQLLGDKMPVLKVNFSGRHRLKTALRVRFGEGFRNLQGIDGLLKEFDDEIEHEMRVIKLKGVLTGVRKKRES